MSNGLTIYIFFCVLFILLILFILSAIIVNIQEENIQEENIQIHEFLPMYKETESIPEYIESI